MGRSPCCSKVPQKRAWSAEEDFILAVYIKNHGDGAWDCVPNKTGLKRSGKSCRLRWLNYLRPGIKHGNISPDEEDLIIKMHHLLGNRWSLIAKLLPGRTDNEIKNYWNTHLRKRAAKSQNPNTSNSSSTSIEDNCVLKGKPIETTALTHPGTLISDGYDNSVKIKEKEDHADLNFSFTDDLHVSLIETKYWDEICPFDSHIELRNSFESHVELERSFAVEMLDNHAQLELQCLLKSKLQSFRQILELEDE